MTAPGQFIRVTSGQLEPVTDRQALTVDNTSGGVTLTVPATAICAVCRLETAQIRYTLDGTAPTTTVGTILNPDDVLTLPTRACLTGFKAIRTGGASGTLQVEYLAVDS